jgi:hypothetical protein
MSDAAAARQRFDQLQSVQRFSTAPGRFPERPAEASDAELAAVIRRLPEPMAAQAVAAGLLGARVAERAPIAREWSAPLAVATPPIVSRRDARDAPVAAALTESGLSAAPLERAIETHVPTPGDHVAGSAPPHPEAASANLEKLADEVLQRLRWRLAIERERLMG